MALRSSADAHLQEPLHFETSLGGTAMRYRLMVRAGYLGDDGYALRRVARVVDHVGGEVVTSVPLGGVWDVAVVAEFPSHGGAKLAVDTLEEDGIVVEFEHLEPLGSETELATDILVHPDVSETAWKQEAAWWQDWSRPAGMAGEIQRVVDLSQDELGLDSVSIDVSNDLVWKWVNAWVWDPTSPADVGLTAEPPDGWNAQGLGKWIGRAVRVAFRASPVGRAIEIAAAGIYVGKEVYKVAHGHVRTSHRPNRYEYERRAKMYSVVVRQRISRERTPRGEYFRHHYERHERWRRTG